MKVQGVAMSTRLPLAPISTAMDKTLSIKVKRDRPRHGQRSIVCVHFHLLLSLLEMTSIKKKKTKKKPLDNCNANPQKRDHLYFQFPPHFHIASKFTIHKVLEEKELMRGWPGLLQAHTLSSTALKTQKTSK